MPILVQHTPPIFRTAEQEYQTAVAMAAEQERRRREQILMQQQAADRAEQLARDKMAQESAMQSQQIQATMADRQAGYGLERQKLQYGAMQDASKTQYGYDQLNANMQDSAAQRDLYREKNAQDYAITQDRNDVNTYLGEMKLGWEQDKLDQQAQINAQRDSMRSLYAMQEDANKQGVKLTAQQQAEYNKYQDALLKVDSMTNLDDAGKEYTKNMLLSQMAGITKSAKDYAFLQQQQNQPWPEEQGPGKTWMDPNTGVLLTRNQTGDVQKLADPQGGKAALELSKMRQKELMDATKIITDSMMGQYKTDVDIYNNKLKGPKPVAPGQKEFMAARAEAATQLAMLHGESVEEYMYNLDGPKSTNAIQGQQQTGGQMPGQGAQPEPAAPPLTPNQQLFQGLDPQTQTKIRYLQSMFKAAMTSGNTEMMARAKAMYDQLMGSLGSAAPQQ